VYKLKPIIDFEIKKLLKRRNIIVLIVIVLILQIFLQVGFAVFEEANENKKIFQSLEQKKATRYNNYRQYGSYGIWLKFVPHKNSILFYDSTLNNYYCNVDSTYVSNAYIPLKGRQLFTDSSRYLNFCVIFFFLFSLLSLSYGIDMIVRKDYMKYISTSTSSGKTYWYTTIARLTTLSISAIAFYVVSLLLLFFLNGINLFTSSFSILLGCILSIFLFFSLGTLIGLINLKMTRGLAAILLYLFLVIFLPWVLSLYTQISSKEIVPLIEYDNRNFEILMEQEDKQLKEYGELKQGDIPIEDAINDYKRRMEIMKNVFRKNENKFIELSINKVKEKQTIASLIPSLFYYSICESNSSLGLMSIIDFHSYCQKQKEKFSDFISSNAFLIKKENIKNFFKKEEDLFQSMPKIPYNFWLGVFLSLIYTILLLFFSFRMQAKRLKNQSPRSYYTLPLDKGNVLYTHCENEDIKTDIFNHFLQQKGVACIAKMNTEDFQFNGVKPVELLKHLCILSGVEKDKAEENLKLMGINDINGFKQISRDLVQKIIVAIKTAIDCDKIVLDDFFKQETREFERAVFNLLQASEKKGKKIIYLSTQPYQTSTSLEEEIEVDKLVIFPLDLNDVSFR